MQTPRLLRRPVARAPRAVLLAAEHDELITVLPLLLHCLLEVHLLAAGHVDGVGPDFVVEHLVLDPRVRKGRSHHDLVVAPAASLLIKIVLFHSLFNQVLACWRAFGDVARRRDL